MSSRSTAASVRIGIGRRRRALLQVPSRSDSVFRRARRPPCPTNSRWIWPACSMPSRDLPGGGRTSGLLPPRAVLRRSRRPGRAALTSVGRSAPSPRRCRWPSRRTRRASTAAVRRSRSRSPTSSRASCSSICKPSRSASPRSSPGPRRQPGLDHVELPQRRAGRVDPRRDTVGRVVGDVVIVADNAHFRCCARV